MPLIDFKEIPQANTGEGNQDTFELFTRDFLREIGYTVIEEPARGADGGKDLIVLEKREGIGGTTEIRWLVSCKHFSHNKKSKRGKSVSPNDELNILDRVTSKKCDGFIGFYSTLPSEGLLTTLRGLSSKIGFGFHIFDGETIESLLVGYSKREELFLRFFPNSYKKWKELYYYQEPVKLFDYFLGKENSDYLSSEVALMKRIFKNNENIIKKLKNTNSLEEMLGNQEITLITTEIIWEILNNTGRFLPESTSSLAVGEILEKLIPKVLLSEKIINVELGKPVSISFNFDSKFKEAHFQYLNHLISTTKSADNLKTLYTNLKEILN